MKSVYAIRIYELLMKEQMTRFIPADGVSVILAIKTIREACDCETKYEKFSQFKSKVIDIAVKEICRCTSYTVSYECLKKGRSIEAFRFSSLIQSITKYNYLLFSQLVCIRFVFFEYFWSIFLTISQNCFSISSSSSGVSFDSSIISPLFLKTPM